MKPPPESAPDFALPEELLLVDLGTIESLLGETARLYDRHYSPLSRVVAATVNMITTALAKPAAARISGPGGVAQLTLSTRPSALKM